MAVYVKIEDAVLDALKRTMEAPEDHIGNAAAEAAFFHANYVLGSVPETVKGKLNVVISDVNENEVEIRYEPKAGAEGATLTGSKPGTDSIFLSLDKLGGSTTRAPQTSRTSGDQGIFLARLSLTGRPSIDAYLMKNVEGLMERANDLTLEVAMQQATDSLKKWFEVNGIVFNEEAGGGGRYQTTHDTTLPTGAEVPGGRFIVGEF